VEQVEDTKARRRFGLFRWLIVLLIVLNVFAARAIAPILPAIEVPAEKITHLFGDYYLTNTIVATCRHTDWRCDPDPHGFCGIPGDKAWG
jgi:hypothetical protein